MNLQSPLNDLPLAVHPSHMREVDCYLCASTRRRIRFSEGPFRLVECMDCGLVYTTPQLDSEGLSALYQESYWESTRARDYGYMNYVRDRDLYVRTFRKRLATLTPHRKSGRLLDVGCAAGFFLAVAREAGFEGHGIDVAAPMVRYAREELGLENIREGTLESAGYPDAHFDIITLWDVVEHLSDPAGLLEECRRVLKPGGLLVLETQNVHSPFARVMGRRWHHFKMLEHLYHFDPKTCTALLDRAGFEVQQWTPRRAGKYVSVDFVIERTGRLHRLLPFLLAPFKIFRRSAVYVNPFDEMIFFARPRPAAPRKSHPHAS